MSQHAPRLVVIPTIKRPDGLTRAIDSILLQEGVPEDDAEIVVVDNDPEGSAEQVVHRFNNSRFALRYVHEPSPGVANARNAAISAINSRLIAFLDDDESAPPTWLATLLNAHEQYNAAVTFGPVITALPRTIWNTQNIRKPFSPQISVRTIFWLANSCSTWSRRRGTPSLTHAPMRPAGKMTSSTNWMISKMPVSGRKCV